MKQLLAPLCTLLLIVYGCTQKPTAIPTKVTHILTAFNGMKSGFKPDGSKNHYLAQVTTLKGVDDFTPQDSASKPPYTFGFIQLLYIKANIETVFSLPPNQDFTIILSGNTNVDNSTFKFKLSGPKPATDTSQTRVVPTKRDYRLPVKFKGNQSGQYGLSITASHAENLNFFIITELKIETN